LKLNESRRLRLAAAGRPLVAALAVAAVIGLVACGDDSDDTATEAETTVTPAVAIEEIAAVEQGLAAAEKAYARGDAAEAEELASTAYLEHFELVEGPLEEVDEELNESLEELIREELRGAIAEGAPVSEVSKLVDQAMDGLDEARTALQQE
jgi:hypothetical protein